MESDLLLELSCNLTNQSLEGELPDQQVGLNKQGKEKRDSTTRVEQKIKPYALLEFSDLSEGNGSRFESVRLLDSGDDGGRLPGDLLGGKLFARHLLSCALTSSLFGTSHLQ